MSFKKFTYLTILLSAVSLCLAQNEYEADVDSAWIAKQNGGNTELNAGADEPNPDCIGDGCGFEPPPQQESASAQETAQGSSEASSENAESADSTKTANVAKADSANKAGETDEDEDDYEDDADGRNIVETADMYRARKEGFSKAVQVGFRVAGGLNNIFIGDNASDWAFGFEGSVGILAKLTIVRDFAIQAELDYTYRRFNYESKTDYAKNEAYIDMKLFEIPVVFCYTFLDDFLHLGIGVDLSLKLDSESEFKQTVKTDDGTEKDKRNNTIPTTGVQAGGLVDFIFSIDKNWAIDLRAVQNFMELLNEKAVAESSISKSKLFSFHTSLGITFLL